VRDRDSMTQERVGLDRLIGYLEKALEPPSPDHA
jgi:glycyl-tRNA synthetase (class II)